MESLLRRSTRLRVRTVRVHSGSVRAQKSAPCCVVALADAARSALRRCACVWPRWTLLRQLAGSEPAAGNDDKRLPSACALEVDAGAAARRWHSSCSCTAGGQHRQQRCAPRGRPPPRTECFNSIHSRCAVFLCVPLALRCRRYCRAGSAYLPRRHSLTPKPCRSGAVAAYTASAHAALRGFVQRFSARAALLPACASRRACARLQRVASELRRAEAEATRAASTTPVPALWRSGRLRRVRRAHGRTRAAGRAAAGGQRARGGAPGAHTVARCRARVGTR
jgi:hypothetical protein